MRSLSLNRLSKSLFRNTYLTKVLTPKNKNKVVAYGSALAVMVIGSVIVLSHAATSVVSLEGEDGTLSNKIASVTDTSASGGRAIKFGSALQASYPTTPPALICGNTSILNGPSSAPAGAISVPAGDNSAVNFSQASKEYWFAPGIHTLGAGQFNQITPAANSTFTGAPGAILDGQHLNSYAFTQQASGVTVQYLTIRNFGAPGSNNNEGVVNHDAGPNWTIKNNTITANAGAGVMIGSGDVLRNNCLTQNEQYGFSAYLPSGPINITLDHNEISYNNTYDWEAKIDGCGCTGGGKFWDVNGASITGNYVHHNYSVGLWADNNNRGLLFDGNYISNNSNSGIMYEASYNGKIVNNNITANAIVFGPGNPGFPTGAIYLSEAGSDSRVNSLYNQTFEIANNLIQDNWSGVILWENADRYCGSPANTTTGSCTLVNPSVVTVNSCNATNINNAPYYDDCRWKTQNVKIHNNVFISHPASISGQCSFATGCGYNGIFSQWGTYPDWSPYTGSTVENHIAHNQNNSFSSNTYQGSWQYMIPEQGTQVTYNTWRAAPNNQDTGSTTGP